MNTLSKKGGSEVFYLPLFTNLLEIKAGWEDGYLIRLDIKLCGGAFNGNGNPDVNPVAYKSGLGERLAAIMDGSDQMGQIPAKAKGSMFQTRVWTVLLSVPGGMVITYGELAAKVGCQSPRAVGQALKANPLPIIIPCHRVVGRYGWLGGFSCGIEVKELLLRRERRLRHEDCCYKRQP